VSHAVSTEETAEESASSEPETRSEGKRGQQLSVSAESEDEKNKDSSPAASEIRNTAALEVDSSAVPEIGDFDSSSLEQSRDPLADSDELQAEIEEDDKSRLQAAGRAAEHKDSEAKQKRGSSEDSEPDDSKHRRAVRMRPQPARFELTGPHVKNGSNTTVIGHSLVKNDLELRFGSAVRVTGDKDKAVCLIVAVGQRGRKKPRYFVRLWNRAKQQLMQGDAAPTSLELCRDEKDATESELDLIKAALEDEQEAASRRRSAKAAKKADSSPDCRASSPPRTRRSASVEQKSSGQKRKRSPPAARSQSTRKASPSLTTRNPTRSIENKEPAAAVPAAQSKSNVRDEPPAPPPGPPPTPHRDNKPPRPSNSHLSASNHAVRNPPAAVLHSSSSNQALDPEDLPDADPLPEASARGRSDQSPPASPLDAHNRSALIRVSTHGSNRRDTRTAFRDLTNVVSAPQRM